MFNTKWKEKSIWRQKSGTASNNACSLVIKVGGRLPALPVGSAANEFNHAKL